jgi:hypothetical protein
MSTIEEQQTAFVSFDNYQKNISKKNQTAHKAAVTHIGTSYYIKAPKPIRISKHSSVTTDLGLKFKVQTCKRFNDDKWLVTGDVYSIDDSNVQDRSKIQAQKDLIRDGVLMPRLGWTVTFMPGLQPMPIIEYKNQEIPPPRRAWVHRDATDEAIVFSTDRKFVSPCSSDGEVISTDRMQRLHQLARRMIDFGTYSRHLSHHKLNNDQKEEESEPITDIEMEFVGAMILASQQIDQANKFEADLVAHLNENHKRTDRLFAFPLSPNCETSHEGMLKVFADIGESLRFFDIQEGECDDLGRSTDLGRATIVPTAKKRKVHLCVDQLSAKMFRHLSLRRHNNSVRPYPIG